MKTYGVEHSSSKNTLVRCKWIIPAREPNWHVEGAVFRHEVVVGHEVYLGHN